MGCVHADLVPIDVLMGIPVPFGSRAASARFGLAAHGHASALTATHDRKGRAGVSGGAAVGRGAGGSSSGSGDGGGGDGNGGGSALGDEECIRSLLADGDDDAQGCLGLLPAIHTTHHTPLQQQRWDELDLRIVVPLPRVPSPAAAGLTRSTDGPAVLTNPSVYCRRGRLLLAARAMWAVGVQPPCTDVWRSHTLLTSIMYDGANLSLAPAPRRADTSAISSSDATSIVDSTPRPVARFRTTLA